MTRSDNDWAFGSGGFSKLYGERLAESSLLDCAVPTRWAFVFMLSQADAKGRYRCASVRGLARASVLSLEEATRAIEELEAPDPNSTTPIDEGRRVRRIQGGWQIVNYEHYRDFRTVRQVQDADRQKRKRERDESRDVTATSPPDVRDQTTEVREQTPESKGNSDSASAAIGSRYQRKDGDVVWFNPDDSVGWDGRAATVLEKRFPARTRMLARRGENWLTELRGLSNWHESAPKTKKKRVSAQRWLFGRLFPTAEREAIHAEKHRPTPPSAVKQAENYQLADPGETKAAIRACKRDHKRERVKGSDVWYCHDKCGWTELLPEEMRWKSQKQDRTEAS